MKALFPLFLGKIKKYKPIQVKNVAKAVLAMARNDYKKIWI
tara:strand:+ start:311 stop:433 length:123 start_codon:yes stop_codon:yes gene_type:complete